MRLFSFAITPKMLQKQLPENRQTWLTQLRNIGKIKIQILENIMHTQGIDPNISNAEINYFQKLSFL
jgi:hypothetical protein